jgi:integrase
MKVTNENLQRFRAWILGRGRSEDTAELYTLCVRKCAEDELGVTNRLVTKRLSPNTKRANMAALAAWAKFSKDTDLRDSLEDIRLPPARRVNAKIPLDRDDWRRVVAHLRTCDVPSEAMRNVLLIIAIRGLRCSDALRIRRSDVVKALSTGRLLYEGKGSKRMEISAEPIRAQLEALAGERGKWERVRDLVGVGSPRAMRRKIARYVARTAKECGIEGMHPHLYRHTFATNFLSELRGDPNAIVKLQKFMGWEAMATAARYVDSVKQSELDDVGTRLIDSLDDGRQVGRRRRSLKTGKHVSRSR